MKKKPAVRHRLSTVQRIFFSYVFICLVPVVILAGVLAAGLVLAVGALAALDFRRGFTVFHADYFPGKDNWLFNPATDEIILIMPERFFLNCALLIGAVLLSACGALIAGDLLSAHRRKKKTVLPR